MTWRDWRDWPDHYLARFRWYRRRRRGRWERWWIDTPVAAHLWFHNPRWGRAGRPGLGRGMPDVEDYG
jgi:hypothetical protein